MAQRRLRDIELGPSQQVANWNIQRAQVGLSARRSRRCQRCQSRNSPASPRQPGPRPQLGQGRQGRPDPRNGLWPTSSWIARPHFSSLPIAMAADGARHVHGLPRSRSRLRRRNFGFAVRGRCGRGRERGRRLARLRASRFAAGARCLGRSFCAPVRARRRVASLPRSRSRRTRGFLLTNPEDPRVARRKRWIEDPPVARGPQPPGMEPRSYPNRSPPPPPPRDRVPAHNPRVPPGDPLMIPLIEARQLARLATRYLAASLGAAGSRRPASFTAEKETRASADGPATRGRVC